METTKKYDDSKYVPRVGSMYLLFYESTLVFM